MTKTVRLRSLAAVAVCLCVASAAHAGSIWLSNNFATVVPGDVYRSAQPGAGQLAAYQKTYGVRTVINLRGANENDAWYRTEKETTEKLGLRQIDFRMKSSVALSPEESARLIDLMKTAEKPILIHCKAGADRTGLASALYLAAIEKAGEEKAEAQLSIRYGHFSVPYLSSAYPMDVSFENMEGALGYHGS